MKTLLLLSLISIILTSCKTETRITESKTPFDLKKDYAEFQTKMSEQDTIQVWIAVPTCFPPIKTEKLTLTKKGKLITIVTSHNDDIQKSKEFIEQTSIKISENDSIWKFGAFLKNNTYRTKIKTKKQGVIQLEHKSEKIHFYTTNKSQHNEFIKNYTDTMLRINPNARVYVEDIEVIEVIEEHNTMTQNTK